MVKSTKKGVLYMKKTLEDKLIIHEEKLKNYKNMLKIMPEDTILGRLCIVSYIKREEKKIQEIKAQLASLANDPI